jgi:nucleotide-binding universal stress UspA family protein
MKILMGVDESEFPKELVLAIVAQLRPEATAVLVLHVLQQQVALAVPEMDFGYAPDIEGEKKSACALVDRIAKELRSAGFQAATAVEIGDVRECIIDAATKWHADLIFVGSHGKNGIRRFLLGSVAEFVARHANCSVEIVRRQKSI